MPLGVLPFGGFTAGEAVIEPGSTILLYTDGLVEERGVSIEDGLERLRAAIEVAPDDPHAMCDYLLATVPPGGAINDDVALLATTPRCRSTRARSSCACPPSPPRLR